MKIFKTLSVSFMLAGALVSAPVSGNISSGVVKYVEFPAKTVCIKHPAAASVDKYFSEATIVHFEIYKVGSQAAIKRVIAAFLKDKDVESCTAGVVTGDFQAFDVSLKNPKNKAWFVSTWKNGGSNDIKINTAEPIELDKL